MASDWPNDADSVLSSLWGSLVNGAASGRDAANMWQSLREGAYSRAESILNITSPTTPTEAEIQAKGQELIAHVTVMDMNRYTKMAGEYLAARQNLQTLDLNQQITGNSIFTPRWATTADNPAVPTRYRIRVLRSITYRGIGTTTEKWSTYEINAPLTTVADALSQANSLFSQQNYNRSAGINEVLDYVIETV
jgi:hypothetical protein